MNSNRKFKKFAVLAVLCLMFGNTFILIADIVMSACCSPWEDKCSSVFYGSAGGCGADFTCLCGNDAPSGTSGCCNAWAAGACGEMACESDERYYYRGCLSNSCNTADCVWECGCATDQCNSDADCKEKPVDNLCTTDTCNNPASSCSTCSRTNRPAGTDCGNCRFCDSSGNCNWACAGTEPSCECKADTCIDCSTYYGDDCGSNGCSLEKRPSWSCSSNTCSVGSCYYSDVCCKNYGSQIQCEESLNLNCKWCYCSGLRSPVRSCVSASGTCQYQCLVGGGCGAVCDDTTKPSPDCQNRCNAACAKSSTTECKSDCTCKYPACPTDEANCGTDGCCDDGIDNDCDGLTDCSDPGCAQDLACMPANPCGTGYFGCYNYIGSGTCNDPIEGPIAGVGCCWKFKFTAPSGIQTYCCYEKYDDTKPDNCPSYCEWEVDHWNWVHNIPNDKCTFGGWACDPLSADITTCTGQGQCCDGTCSATGGCGLNPNHGRCSGYVCISNEADPNYCKCKSICYSDSDCNTANGYYCYCGKCSKTFTSENCGVAQCCNRGYGGTGIGSCVPEGSITSDKRYLCDPPGWGGEIGTEIKTGNVFDLISNFFFQFLGSHK